MYLIYLAANMWIFSMILMIPLLGYTAVFGALDDDSALFQIAGFGLLGVMGWLSHASAIHQCDKDTDIFQGIELGFQDSITYLKLFLRIG